MWWRRECVRVCVLKVVICMSMYMYVYVCVTSWSGRFIWRWVCICMYVYVYILYRKCVYWHESVNIHENRQYWRKSSKVVKSDISWGVPRRPIPRSKTMSRGVDFMKKWSETWNFVKFHEIWVRNTLFEVRDPTFEVDVCWFQYFSQRFLDVKFDVSEGQKVTFGPLFHEISRNFTFRTTFSWNLGPRMTFGGVPWPLTEEVQNHGLEVEFHQYWRFPWISWILIKVWMTLCHVVYSDIYLTSRIYKSLLPYGKCPEPWKNREFTS